MPANLATSTVCVREANRMRNRKREESEVVRPLTAAVAAYGFAVLVGALGAGLYGDDVRHGGQAVSLLALAACTVLARHGAPRDRQRLVLVFCLVLAAAAVVDLAADRIPVPPPAPRGPNGCPLASEAVTDFWRARLRLGQLAETLRAVALNCAALAVRLLPHPLRRWVWLRYAVIPVVLYPLLSPSDALPAAPAVLSLAAATVLVVLAVPRGLVLTASAVVMLLSAIAGIDNLAGLHHQLPEPDPPTVFSACVYGAGGPASLEWATFAFALALIFLAAPAAFAWTVLRARSVG